MRSVFAAAQPAALYGICNGRVEDVFWVAGRVRWKGVVRICITVAVVVLRRILLWLDNVHLRPSVGHICSPLLPSYTIALKEDTVRLALHRIGEMQ